MHMYISRIGSTGSVVFTDIPTRENNRSYILRITAKSTDGLRTVIRRAVRLGGCIGL